MKHDFMGATDVGRYGRNHFVKMNHSYRRGYAGAADANPLQGIDWLVLCTVGQPNTLPIFHFGYWLCSDLEATLTAFSKQSTPHSKLLKLRTWMSLSLIATATTLPDVVMVEGSNSRLACFLQLNPPSLLYFDVTDSQKRVIQPEKALYGLGCYVDNGREHSGALRQLLAVCGAIDLVRWGSRNVFD